MKVMTKKMLRTILQTPGQSLAVVMVVLCGTACYITLASAHRNLLLTRDTYYAQYRLADFEIMLERVPVTTLFKVEELAGVRQVRGRIVKDVTLDIEGIDETRVGRVISMPNRRDAVLNDVVILAGRYFTEGMQNEVILSERFAQENGLSVGASIAMSLEGKKYALRIVGLGQSPEYIYMTRSIQDIIPNPERFGILWVPQDFAETAMDMQAACNNIIGSVDDLDQLDQILDEADDLLDSYGVFAKVKKEDQVSNRFISDEIQALGVLAYIIPSIFLGIAALVILVLLNRMVRNERTQIGLLKAFGYSNWAVASHYLQFALLLSVAGSLGGFFVGQLLANMLIRMYVTFVYQIPMLESRIYPEILARALGIATGFALLGALSAAWRAAHIQPAESMRPEAPRLAHRTWIEEFDALWRRLSFSSKMIVRNVARNRFRSSLNAFAVMVSSGLLIVGFSAIDSMDYLLKFMFEVTQREDVKVGFVSERGKGALYEAARFDHVQLAEPVLEYPFELRAGWRKKDIMIVGLPRNAQLQKLTDDKERVVDIGERGLVLSEYLAEDLGVEVGSMVTLKPLMGRVTGEKRVTVSKIVKQYFGYSGYMNIEALSRVLDEGFAMNAVLLKVEGGMAHELNRKLKDVSGVSSVIVKADSLQGLKDTIAASMDISSAMIVFFAGIIAFSVIYNVTAVSLAERQRELASLRVLGFSNAEVGRIIYHENFLTGVIGLSLGMPFGIVICLWVVRAFDNDLYRLPFYIDPKTLIIANVASILFVGIANFSVRWKIHRLDMVEVLKERG